jgi:hypothetical protein
MPHQLPSDEYPAPPQHPHLTLRDGSRVCHANKTELVGGTKFVSRYGVAAESCRRYPTALARQI